MSSTRQPVLPQLTRKTFHVRGPKRFKLAAWLAAGLAVIMLVLALVMPYWLPRTIRAIIPDRYIAAYAPKFVQDVVFARFGEENVPEFSPSRSSAQTVQLQSLLASATPTSSLLGAAVAIVPTATNVPTPLPPLPASFSLGENHFRNTPQAWNNCGPATLTMLLSYWGQPDTQDEVAGFVKPNPEDRNVRPDELAAYVESTGYKMVVRVNGTQELLKRFISSGYPIMIEQGFEVPNVPGWMGHYSLLYEYSDADQTFKAMDSYDGPGYVYTYDRIKTYWRHFNRTYLVAYRPEQAAEVASIIGPEIDDTTMYQDALAVAKDEVTKSPTDTFGWFNLGSNLVALGDYQNAAAAYDAAYNTGKVPWRMLWYQYGPYQAYLHMDRYQDVMTLADRTLFENVYSEEAYYYKALAYSAQGNADGARRQLQLALLYNKHYKTAQYELNKLTQ